MYLTHKLKAPPGKNKRPVEARGSLARSIAEVAEQLKKEHLAAKGMKHQREVTRQMQERPATKKDGKLPKLTHNTGSSYGANVFSTCPSGGARGNNFTPMALMKMAEHPETGCRTATRAEEQRLGNSSLNANTTYGNYNSTHLHRR